MFRLGLIGISIPCIAIAVQEYLYPREVGSESLTKRLAERASTTIHADKAQQLKEGEQSLIGYPFSYYAAVNKEPLPYRGAYKVEKGEEPQVVDVCVIGGGLAGINTALGLAERGLSVVVLESKRVGWNASGRNGGFALAGIMREPADLIADLGEKEARDYYQRTVRALHLLRQRIDTYQVQCDVQDAGSLEISRFPSSDPEEDEAEVKYINTVLGTKFEYWSADKCRQLYKSPTYFHAFYDPTGFIVQPLGLTAGLARAAESKGVRIYENSPAYQINSDVTNARHQSRHRFSVVTGESESQAAELYCDNVVLTGSCHLPRSLDTSLAVSVAPMFTYIGVTKPLGELLETAIAKEAPYSVCDDLAQLNYFRPTPDGRILWGGFAQTYEIPADRVASEIQKLIHQNFPSIPADVEIEYSWGGDIGVEIAQYPLIGMRRPGYYYATGFGGHGVVPTTMAAEMIAHAIASKDDSEILAYQKKFPLSWSGWPFDRLVAQTVYSSWSLLDHFNIFTSELKEKVRTIFHA